MNIFVLDLDVAKCAEYHANCHVVKMILETAQLLSGAVNLQNGGQISGLYKTTHKNHPCAIWARTSRENFKWLSNLGLALCEEYSLRYGKPHKSKAVIDAAAALLETLPPVGLTPYAQAMPEQYRDADPVIAYRNYYRAEKAQIAKWSKRNSPFWF